MKWGRNTKEFEYAPYKSEDGRFIVGELHDNKWLVPEYEELSIHNWDNEETHKAFINYCKQNNIKLNGATWVLLDDGKFIGYFKTAKAGKEYAETL